MEDIRTEETEALKQELEEGQLLATWEVAEILGCTPRTVHNYRNLGMLSAIRLNSRTYRFRESDVNKFIAMRYLESVEPAISKVASIFYAAHKRSSSQ